MILGTKEKMVRFSFVNVFEPESVLGSDPKFSVQILVPKTDTHAVAQIKTGINDAIAKGIEKGLFSKNNTQAKTFRTCLRDGDAEAEEQPTKAYLRGYYFFNASCSEKNPPQVVDKFAKPIMDRTQFYAGCWGCVDVNFFPFKYGVGGVSAGLNSIMKRDDGERLDGRATAEQAFAQVADDDSLPNGDGLLD